MRVYFLGSNGWIPNKDETSCVMIEHKGQLILLDAGTGVSNIRDFREVLHRYGTLTIILSHYHLDHTIGLIYLLPYINRMKLRVYGPGKPIYDKTTQDILEELLNPIFFSRPLLKFCDNVKCFDYSGSDFYTGDIHIKIKPQVHSAPSFRISIDDCLIYATDTVFNASEWQEDYRGMTLLHECWDITKQHTTKHTSLEGLISGLPRYLLKSTYLIHKNPMWGKNEHDMLTTYNQKYGIKVAEDGMVIDIYSGE